jgi:hypothetical protein
MENHVPLSDPEGMGMPGQRDKERIDETEYLDNKSI